MPRKRSLINIIVATLLALLTILSGFLSSVASNNLPKAVAPYLQFVWPLLGIVTLAFIILIVWQAVRQSPRDQDEQSTWRQHRQESLEKQHRQRMIERVRAFWVKGVLEQSLHGAAIIALGLHERPDALENPWRLMIQQPDQLARVLPPGTRITQVYDDSSGELLILGEPGAGKTTLLLELACNLLDRAQKDDTHLIPVVFNLSSWAEKRLPLVAWLDEELNTKYQVPHKLGQQWIDSDRILPLLDGLDEVASTHRSACVKAINAYRMEHMVPMVMCSRIADYFAQDTRVQLRYAVSVQPLTPEQIDNYLWSARGQLEAVRVALHQDKQLQELATTPLMLSVLTLAYHGKKVEDIPMEDSLETSRQQIFKSYVQRMLQRRSAQTRYSAQQVIRWLAWQAKQLILDDQVVFSANVVCFRELLEEDSSRWLYYGWYMKELGACFGLAFGLVFGLVFDFGFGLSAALVVGLFVGMIVLLFFSIGGADEDSRNYRAKLDKKLSFWLGFGLVPGLTVYGVVGLIIGLAIGLVVGLPFIWGINLVIRLVPGFIAVLIRVLGIVLDFGLLFVLFWLVIYQFSDGILSEVTHYLDQCVLRLLLWHDGVIPLNYSRFLNYAAERILLRKIDNFYLFPHRLLQEYFASLDTTTRTSLMTLAREYINKSKGI